MFERYINGVALVKYFILCRLISNDSLIIIAFIKRGKCKEIPKHRGPVASERYVSLLLERA